MSMPEAGERQVDLGEAARQLQQAAHDARVAFDCMGLGELDRAHTHAITARAAADAAENLLRAALADEPAPLTRPEGRGAVGVSPFPRSLTCGPPGSGL